MVHRDVDAATISFVLQLGGPALEARGLNVRTTPTTSRQGARGARRSARPSRRPTRAVFVDRPRLGGVGRSQTERRGACSGRQATRPCRTGDDDRRTPGLLTHQTSTPATGTSLDVTVDRVVEAIEPTTTGPPPTARLGRALARGRRAGGTAARSCGRGKELAAPEEWAGRPIRAPQAPADRTQSAYIAESGRAERRRMRRLATAACIAVALAVTLAVLALLQRSEAIAQRDEARTLELAAKAGQQLEVDPELAILLALESLRTDRTAEGVDALRRAVSESCVRDVLGSHADGVTTIALQS